MFDRIRLQCLYALLMVLPLRLVRWHIERLPERAALALLGLHL